MFAYVQNIEREHEWQANLVSATQLTPEPLQIGTRRRYVTRMLGRTVTTTYVVIELLPERTLVYETCPGAEMWSRWQISCDPVDAHTRVTMRIDAAVVGWIRLIPRIALVATARRELAMILDSLRRSLERP